MKLYGFKTKELPWGERVPDAPLIVRIAMHYFWLLAWHTIPTKWMLERSGKIRNTIGVYALQAFAWWGYEHLKYHGYSKETFEEWSKIYSEKPKAF